MTDSGAPLVSGARIRRLRVSRGWTLIDLEKACGEAGHRIDFAQLARYERGEQQPRPRTLTVLAQALGIEIGDMFAAENSESAA